MIFNLIKRKQEKTDALQDILGSTDISVFPLSLKDKIGRKNDEGKSRQKRWVPFSPLFGGKKKKAEETIYETGKNNHKLIIASIGNQVNLIKAC